MKKSTLLALCSVPVIVSIAQYLGGWGKTMALALAALCATFALVSTKRKERT